MIKVSDPILAWELVPWQFESLDLGPSLFWYWALGLTEPSPELGSSDSHRARTICALCTNWEAG